MYKVIGGEFSIDKNLLNKTKDFNENAIFSSGRSALFHILYNERPTGGTILVPNYLCESVTRTIIEAGWKYKWYNIDENFKIDLDEIIEYKDIDAILFINYFGLCKLDNIITEIREAKHNIILIEDDVQAFFDYKNSNADYAFTSLRKWFPCPDGAFINTNKELKSIDVSESKWNQYKFAGNILKNYNNIDDSIYLELLAKGESLLDEEYLSICSEISQIIYANIDFNLVADKRKQNAKFLHCRLKELGIKHLYNKDSVPLFIPVLIKNRELLRKEFFKNNIYAPIHWPHVNSDLNGNNDLYSIELSLICDQRYSIEDMSRQIEILRKFFRGEERTVGEFNSRGME